MNKRKRKKNYPKQQKYIICTFTSMYIILNWRQKKKFSGKKTIKLLKIAFFKYIIDVM